MPKKITINEFIKRANETHKNYYDYSLAIYKKSSEKIEIICPKHGAFWQKVGNHLIGQGCPNCAHEVRAKSNRENAFMQRLTQEDFLIRAIKIHGNFYDYSKTIIVGLENHVKIKCPKHGIFEQMAQAHIVNGQGCPVCAKEKKLRVENFYNDANTLYGNFYDYSKVDLDAFVEGTVDKIIVICKNHGEFLVRPCYHLSPRTGSGCSGCQYEKVKQANKKRKMTTDEFIKKSQQIHGIKYNYDVTIYNNIDTLVKITCPIHGVFEQKPCNHLQGNGCQKCANSATSIMEQEWLDDLDICNEKRHIPIFIRNKKVIPDAFDLETNTVYEFWGDYYHGNPEIYEADDLNQKVKKTFGYLHQKTLEKIDLYKGNDYNLIEIWEREWLIKRGIK